MLQVAPRADATRQHVVRCVTSASHRSFLDRKLLYVHHSNHAASPAPCWVSLGVFLVFVLMFVLLVFVLVLVFLPLLDCPFHPVLVPGRGETPSR